MPSPFFTVLHRYNDTKTAHVINTLEKYYVVYVDGTKTISEIMHTYKGFNGKFFCFDEKWFLLDVEDLEGEEPLFCVAFDSDHKTTPDEYRTLLQFVDRIFKNETLCDELWAKIQEIVQNPPVCKELPIPYKIEYPTPEPNTKYYFNYEEDKNRNVCYCQIDKPYTDKPYVTIIRNFDDIGFLPMFTAFYVCSSWGITSCDQAFLSKIWNYLDMKKEHGPINLEERLKQAVLDCQPREGHVPNAEPEVYRVTISELKNMFQTRNKHRIELYSKR